MWVEQCEWWWRSLDDGWRASAVWREVKVKSGTWRAELEVWVVDQSL